MDHYKEESLLHQLFQVQRKEEEGGAPDFSILIEKAIKKQRKMKNIRWAIGVAVGLLILSGLAIFTQHQEEGSEDRPIAKAGISLFEKLEAEGKIVTNDIHFAFDRADLKPASMTIIKAIVRMMEEHPEVRLSVEGHSDNQGSTNYNQKLSEARAAAVRQAIVGQGIEPARLRSAGFGESRPVADNGSESGRAKNRRVEFVRF